MDKTASDMTEQQHSSTSREQLQERVNELRSQSHALTLQIHRELQQAKEYRIQNCQVASADRHRFVTTLSADVAAMLKKFQWLREQGKTERAKQRADFLTNMRKTLHEQLTQYRQQRSGANNDLSAETVAAAPEIETVQTETQLRNGLLATHSPQEVEERLSEETAPTETNEAVASEEMINVADETQATAAPFALVEENMPLLIEDNASPAQAVEEAMSEHPPDTHTAKTQTSSSGRTKRSNQSSTRRTRSAQRKTPPKTDGGDE